MKFSYKFNNLCGSVYKGGNLLFTADGNTVLSPVGNRITMFDLVSHTSQTLPCENKYNIQYIALSPNGSTLISIDEQNNGIIINLQRQVVLAEISFTEKVNALEFSPDGKYIAIGQGKILQIWRSPPLVTQYRPLILHRSFSGHYDTITCLSWSPDSLFVLTGSDDYTARLYSIHSMPGFVPLQLSGHHSRLVGVYFGQVNHDPLSTDHISKTPGSLLYTISQDGSVFTWKWTKRPIPTALEVIKARQLENTNRIKQRGQDDSEDDDDNDDDSDSDNEFGYDLKNENIKDDDTDQTTQNNNAKKTKKNKKSIELLNENRVDSRLSHKRTKMENQGLIGYDNPQQYWDKLPFIARGFYRINKKHFIDLPDHPRIMSTALYGTSQADKLFNTYDISDDILKNRWDNAPTSNLLVVGLTTGTFVLYQMPTFDMIHSLSISGNSINAISINSTGDWLAIGSAQTGQLIVWEWQSESYILKQQSHLSDINCLSYSPDGQLVVTGGDDGKVKVWNTTTGFCFITFSDHVGPVQCVEFTSTGTVILSAGSDGTIRAYDLIRYRNFRTLVTPQPTQFLSLAIDPSGEIVTAGGLDPFEVYVWSLQTGKLLDVLAGHEAPISSMAFSATQSLLATCSWDKTIRVWDIFSGKGQISSLQHESDVLACTYRPDGKELVSIGLDGNLYIWDMFNLELKTTINAKQYFLTGRKQSDVRTANNTHKNRLITTLCYSPDGTCIIAGGESRYAIIFHVERRMLIKRFPISNNMSLDAMLAKLNSHILSSSGISRHDIDLDNVKDSMSQRKSKEQWLPGAERSLDLSKRTTPKAIRSKCIRFSPTGMQWGACTTEGLVIYSLDTNLAFDPVELDMDITPENCLDLLLYEKSYAQALTMALALNQRYLIDFCIMSTPYDQIPFVARVLPRHRLQRLFEVLASLIDKSIHIQLLLLWVHTLLSLHSVYIQQIGNGTITNSSLGTNTTVNTNSIRMLTACKALQRTMSTKLNDLSTICNNNKHMLSYIQTFSIHIDEKTLVDNATQYKIQYEIKQEETLQQLSASITHIQQQKQWEDDDDDDNNYDADADDMDDNDTPIDKDQDGTSHDVNTKKRPPVRTALDNLTGPAMWSDPDDDSDNDNIPDDDAFEDTYASDYDGNTDDDDNDDDASDASDSESSDFPSEDDADPMGLFTNRSVSIADKAKGHRKIVPKDNTTIPSDYQRNRSSSSSRGGGGQDIADDFKVHSDDDDDGAEYEDGDKGLGTTFDLTRTTLSEMDQVDKEFRKQQDRSGGQRGGRGRFADYSDKRGGDRGRGGGRGGRGGHGGGGRGGRGGRGGYRGGDRN